MECSLYKVMYSAHNKNTDKKFYNNVGRDMHMFIVTYFICF